MKKLKRIECDLKGVTNYTTVAMRNVMVGRLPLDVFAEREPDNEYDENAIRIYLVREPPTHLGYVPRKVAAVLAPALDDGRLEFVKGSLDSLEPQEGIGHLVLTFRRL
jgi:HIRAN domain